MTGNKMILRCSSWIAVFALFLQCMACSATELEERCFPLIAAVGYDDNQVSYCLGFPRVENSGEQELQINEIQVPVVLNLSFEKSKEEYESHLNKAADYNHLKVLVLEEDLLEQTKAYEEMLDSLSDAEEFPRNTYVCAVDDIDELFEMNEKLPQELGTYLEEYLNNHEKKKDRLQTLGDLIDEKENKDMVLYIPYLEVEDSFVEWGGYYAIGQGQKALDFN